VIISKCNTAVAAAKAVARALAEATMVAAVGLVPPTVFLSLCFQPSSWKLL
jgi:hypothetical protein